MSVDVSLIEWAAERAASLLAPLGNRWLHVQGVVERARCVGRALDGDDRIYLLAAAYLHDIGYAPSLRMTGFHPLDGAIYVRSFGYERLASLIAHHFAARFEAQLRGCDQLLHEFPRECSPVADALTYCDGTTGPAGEHLSLNERAAEIRSRYTEKDVVVQALRLAMPHLSLAIGRTQQRLLKAGLVTRPPKD
jgi:hypothetical protein